MKKMIIPIIVAIAFLIALPGTSLARNGHGHGHYKNHHGNYYKRGNYYRPRGYYRPYSYYPGPYVYYAPPPVYYAPPPVYYAPPPYYAPYYPPVSGQLFFGITID